MTDSRLDVVANGSTKLYEDRDDRRYRVRVRQIFGTVTYRASVLKYDGADTSRWVSVADREYVGWPTRPKLIEWLDTVRGRIA